MKEIRKPRAWIALFVIGVLGAKLQTEGRGRTITQRRLQLPPLLANYHTQSLARYNFGFQSLISAITWVKLLQDAHWEPMKRGHVSWEYTQLDAITTLNRNFTPAYSFGTGLLSVLRRDNLGAKLLLEKWVRTRPNYWKAHYVLGYHLYFEMEQYQLAAGHILRAAELEGAPPHLTSLGIRLMGETGALIPALALCVELWSGLSGKNPEAKYRVSRRVRALRYALTKAAWELALENYRKEHNAEPPGMAALAPIAQSQARQLASALPSIEMDDDLAQLFQETFTFRYDPGERKIVGEKSIEALGIDVVGIYRQKEE